MVIQDHTETPILDTRSKVQLPPDYARAGSTYFEAWQLLCARNNLFIFFFKKNKLNLFFFKMWNTCSILFHTIPHIDIIYIYLPPLHLERKIMSEID